MNLVFKKRDSQPTGWYLREPIPVGHIENATQVDHKIGPSADDTDELPSVDEALELAADYRNLDVDEIDVVTTPDDLD